MKQKLVADEMSGEFLVAIVQRPLDMTYARAEHWYRIPVESADKLLKKRWPPKWLAFYQTRAFGSEAYSIRYYADVESISKVARRDLFPDEPERVKADKKRDNSLHIHGWQTLRFTTSELREEPESYCVDQIKDAIDNLGGLMEQGKFMPRKFGEEFRYQPSLFDTRAQTEADPLSDLDEGEVWNLGEDI